jgi:CRP/FNR family transcriptional regulator, cyclic AMP receptor protein
MAEPEDLRKEPLFAGLSEDALRELSVWLDEVKVSSGKHLVDEGDYAYNLFVIQGGKAQVIREGEEVAELGPGDFFGEMGVLGQEGRRNATVVAKTQMQLLTLASYDVDRMKKSAPELIDTLTKAIEERSEE